MHPEQMSRRLPRATCIKLKVDAAMLAYHSPHPLSAQVGVTYTNAAAAAVWLAAAFLPAAVHRRQGAVCGRACKSGVGKHGGRAVHRHQPAEYRWVTVKIIRGTQCVENVHSLTILSDCKDEGFGVYTWHRDLVI